MLVLITATLNHYFLSESNSDSPSRQALDRTTVAVASNFSTTAAALLEAFDPQQVHQFDLISGSTGKHTAQISHGQPVDLLLAADTDRPAFLANQGKVWQGHRAVYAVGRLILWRPSRKGASPMANTQPRDFISQHDVVAIANPKLAPYGAAAAQALERFSVDESNVSVVYGENIAQTFQFIDTGNADVGMIAKSQSADLAPESIWEVPSSWHHPIEQEMVLLSSDPRAQALFEFILSARGREIIRAAGYEVIDD